MLTFNFNKININPKGIMLDLGCGEGRHIFGAMEQFPDLKCIGLDPHLESLDKASEGLEFLRINLKHQNKFFKWFSIFSSISMTTLLIWLFVLRFLSIYMNIKMLLIEIQ